MKLNNSGWGLPHLLLGIAIIFIFLLAATFLTLRLDKELNEKLNTGDTTTTKDNSDALINNEVTPYYVDKITSFTNATNKYLDDQNIILEQDSYIKVQLSTLEYYNYMDDITDYYTNKSCKGYALANLDASKIRNISVYLKCDNYTSKGYEN